jgi:hypothetical protein
LTTINQYQLLFVELPTASVTIKIPCQKPGLVVNACNPRYSEGRVKRIAVQGQPQVKNYQGPLSTNKPGMVAIPVAPATKEAEVGGLRSEAISGKSL